jgi:hypothetical protein
MDSAPPPGDTTQAGRFETGATTARRARRDDSPALHVDAAGHAVSPDEVDTWIDSLDTDHELPARGAGL